MKHLCRQPLLMLLLILASVASSAKCLCQTDTTWFSDAGFGMFIHFGLYSIPGGVWKGKPMGRNG